MSKSGNKREQVVSALAVVLADTYVLAVKSHGHHWNVTGPFFAPLHEFFGKQYDALLAAADELAERIRSLGAPAPASMAQFLALAKVKETGRKALTANEMLADLVAAHEIVIGSIHAAKKLAVAADDTATDDMLIGRLAEHDKTLWMLRAQLV